MRVLTSLSIASMFMFSAIATSYAAGGGGGSTMPSGDVDMPRQTPEQMARQDYNSGIGYLKDVTKYESKMDDAKDDKQREKTQEKITKAYEKALKSFSRAAERMPTMHDAWNYVGYTKRHLGDYKGSLAAYAKALELKPNYPEAMEYRGEAFLGMNALDDAKQTYLSLFKMSRPLADQLLTAMKGWVEKRKQNAGGIDSATLDAFANWVNERATVAQTASTAGEAPARW